MKARAIQEDLPRPAPSRGGAGGLRHLPPLPAHRPQGPDAASCSCSWARRGPTASSWSKGCAAGATRFLVPGRRRPDRRPIPTREPKALPQSWRLGSRPNLRQMHDDACQYRVSADLVSVKLREEIENSRASRQAPRGRGEGAHPARKTARRRGRWRLPLRRARSKGGIDASQPSAEARRFLDETTGPDRPRVCRNAVVLAVPSHDGLDLARDRVRDYLGWVEVRAELNQQNLAEADPLRWGDTDRLPGCGPQEDTRRHSAGLRRRGGRRRKGGGAGIQDRSG